MNQIQHKKSKYILSNQWIQDDLLSECDSKAPLTHSNERLVNQAKEHVSRHKAGHWKYPTKKAGKPQNNYQSDGITISNRYSPLSYPLNSQSNFDGYESDAWSDTKELVKQKTVSKSSRTLSKNNKKVYASICCSRKSNLQ